MNDGRKFGGEHRKVFNWTEETMIVGLGIFGWLVCNNPFFKFRKTVLIGVWKRVCCALAAEVPSRNPTIQDNLCDHILVVTVVAVQALSRTHHVNSADRFRWPFLKVFSQLKLVCKVLINVYPQFQS